MPMIITLRTKVTLIFLSFFLFLNKNNNKQTINKQKNSKHFSLHSIISFSAEKKKQSFND